ncbi:MAG TPA: dipeptidase [Pseudomonadales bacterium]|nr:dipeptidase [Pseudomonadales bacterium]
MRNIRVPARADLRRRIGRAILCAVTLLAPTLALGSLDARASGAVLTALEGSEPANFDAFLASVQTLPLAADLDLTALRADLRAGAPLDAARRTSAARLLGLYARIKYADEALATLEELVAIPTFEVEGLPQYENPAFQRMGRTLERLAERFDLAFRNVGGRIYEVSLGGAEGELVGLHAHADVVPVNPDLWVLEDGTRLDPFAVTRIGDRLYGRGTEDDKNGIVVTMFAMRVVKEEGLPLLRHFRLLVDTREETGGDAMPWYFERNPVPDYNIALDGSYPVVIAEKGYGVVMASFPVRETGGEGATVVEMTGGLATNQIPARATVWIRSPAPMPLIDTLNARGAAFAAANGGDFTVRAERDGERVRLDVLGVSAHSSEPGSGINPVSRLLAFVDGLRADEVLEANHFTDAARYATDNWGMDYLGTRLGIAWSDPFMGPLTAAQTFVATDPQRLRTAVNLRLPIGRQPEAVVAEVRAKLDDWATTRRVDVAFDISASDPMYRSPEGAWVNALLDIAVANLGIPREFGSSAGGTSIHDLPGGVQFGLALPTAKYTGHNANEFKTVDQFLVDLSIITEMIATLGTMDEL